MDVKAMRSELEALLKDLAKMGASDATPDESLDLAENAAKDGEHTEALRRLSSYLTGKVDDTEEMLTAHPFAAISAAFMLGVAIGRLSRQ